MSAVDLVTPYREYFQLILARTPELRDAAYRLRYEVYCDDLGWENTAKFPDGREIDHFDPYSLHCLMLHRRSGGYAGTVRLVRASPDSPDPCLPLLEHYDDRLYSPGQRPPTPPDGSYGEISRLALHKNFRRRPGEEQTADGHGAELFGWDQTERRRFPHMALGLYFAAAAAGLAEGMARVYAMMEPRLARHLHFGGIFFEQIGAPVEFRGARAPFFISRQALLERLTPPLRALLEAIAEDLEVKL